MNKRNFIHRPLNADLGEGLDNDAALMPFLQQANIACGKHAGSPELIRETLLLCARHGVAAGAHPSYDDRAHFGRTEQHLPDHELLELVRDQLTLFLRIAADCGVPVTHVKPHGALYNRSARDRHTAFLIATAVKSVDPTLRLFGLSGSVSLEEAEKAGLKTAHEVFADRQYRPDGQLVERREPNALIPSVEAALAQVRELEEKGGLTTVNGDWIPLRADTICIHGDGPLALPIARALHARIP
jgi:UPF0271 protein